MKYPILAISMLLSGCTTNHTTGSKKLLGVVRIPFTGGNNDACTHTDKGVMLEQFAKFQDAALVLVILGAGMWWFTKGATGIGKALIGLGLGLSLWGVIVPSIAGYVGLIAVVSIVCVLIYFAAKFFIKKS